jgi:hypothetical protein
MATTFPTDLERLSNDAADVSGPEGRICHVRLVKGLPGLSRERTCRACGTAFSGLQPHVEATMRNDEAAVAPHYATAHFCNGDCFRDWLDGLD